MPASTALHTIGFYCGRRGTGFFDEPQNSFSNIAFLIGALFAYRLCRGTGVNDRFIHFLMLMLGAIGIGSFTFHSYPTPETLYVDLVPIQLYVVAVLAYVLTRVLRCTWAAAILVAIAFTLIRQAWIHLTPPAMLGGGSTHVPALVALMLLVVILARRRLPMWRHLIAAAACYSAALLARSLDIPLCNSFPLGLHWAWHLLTALAATLVLVGVVRHGQQVMPICPSQHWCLANPSIIRDSE